MGEALKRHGAALGAAALLVAIVTLFGIFSLRRNEPGALPASPVPGAIALYLTTPAAGGGSRGGPDQALVEAIDSAQHSVDVAVYAFNLWSVRDALLRAAERGVRVRMVVESDNILAAEVEDLVRAGIPVVGDRREPLMHHKFVVIDAQEVWTGSMNLTVGSVYADHNNLLRLRSAEVAADFAREFEEMFLEDRFGMLSLPDTPYPETVVDGYRLQVLFSPDDGVAEKILAHLRAARRQIDLMAYAFTLDSISQALLERAAEGVRVRVLVDDRQAEAAGAEYARLRQAGLEVRAYRGRGLLHHKVILIDGTTVITGSYNFTRSAEEYNDEAVVVVNHTDLAHWYTAEFERLYRAGE